MADEQDELRPTRRIVFHGMAALGVAVALAGCGGGGGDDSSSSSSDSAGSSDSPSAAAGKELTKTADVPVGGGIILSGPKIVVTQPTKGEFKAFTAVCTHQGFTVTSVEDDTIKCNHHGSEYSAATGKVKQGPAPSALAAVKIQVKGDAILAA